MVGTGRRLLVSGMRAFLAIALLWSQEPRSALAGERLPSIEDLVAGEREQGKGKAGAGKKRAPVYPRKLEVEEAGLQASLLLPGNPFFYFESGNGRQATAAFAMTGLAKFLAEKRVSRFLRDNPLSLANLFVNLPRSYADPSRTGLYAIGLRFVRAFAGVDARVVLAAYKGGAGGPQVLFLADIGRERKLPCQRLCSLRDAALSKHPGIVLEQADRSDDYVEVMRRKQGGGELAFGLVRNFAVISTSAAFARNLVRVAKAGSRKDALGKSPAFREMARKTDSAAHLRGFIDLRSLLAEAAVNQLPGATEMLDFGSDLLGRGTLFYDLRAEDDHFVEHLVSPPRVNVEAGERPGVPARIMQVCTPPGAETAWTTLKVIPYQPEFFLAARVNPASFAELLAAPQWLGASDYATQISINLPPSLREQDGFLQDLKPVAERLLTGEVALALLSAHQGRRPWVFALALRDAGAVLQRMSKREPVQIISGMNIYSRETEQWQAAPCWTVMRNKMFQNLQASQLVMAATGELLQSLIDQTTAVAASLAENRDFTRQLARIGKGQSLIWYYNLPGIISREYVNLPTLLRRYFPGLASVGGRPPMALVNRYVFGVQGGVAIRRGEGDCRSTVTGSLPALPALAGLTGVALPQWIRQRTRLYLRRSRQNLQRMWLELQTYATQRGHYPSSMRELRGRFSRSQQRDIFISLAAVEEKGLEEAARNSYTYVAGLRPTDEPERPIIYESDAWHYEYLDMMRPHGAEPSETGEYRRWRLVLQIDGTIRAYTEDEFKRKVLKRLKVEE